MKRHATSRRLWATVLVLLVIANVADLYLKAERQKPSPPIAGNVPIQRGRIDQYIDAVKKETIEQSIENLNLYEPLVLRARLSDPYPVYGDPHLTQRCLANRRLARIFEHLSKLPDRDRDQQATAIFDRAYKDLRDVAVRIFDRWEAGPPPTNQRFFDERHTLSSFASALAGAQLLCGQLCPLDIAIQNHMKMEQLRSELKSRLEANQENLKPPYDGIMGEIAPNLFELNLARILFQRHFQVDEMDRIIPKEMIPTETPLFAWNAHTNAQDFTHQRRKVPTDSEHVVHVFSFYSTWHRQGIKEDDRNRVISQCWGELLTKAAPQLDATAKQ